MYVHDVACPFAFTYLCFTTYTHKNISLIDEIDPHVNVLLLGELFLECPSRELELADLNVQLVDDALVLARDVVKLLAVSFQLGDLQERIRQYVSLQERIGVTIAHVLNISTCTCIS